MRLAPEDFGDAEVDLIYIAKRLTDAQKIEERLDQQEIDYFVEPDHYRGGFIFQSVRTGAFFYVRPEDGEKARSVLAVHGFRPQPRDGY